jgi:hypothetical protein
MPGWAAIFLVLAAALIGVVATLVLKQEPGATLGVAIFAGTVIAGLGANYRAAYLIIPVPALTYLVSAFCAGYIHDKSQITGHVELAVHSAEWIGNGFSWMLVATVAAIVVAVGRWLWARQDMLRGHGTGPGPVPSGRQPDARRPGPRSDPQSPGFNSSPSYARPAAGYARSTNLTRPSDPAQMPQRSDPPPPLPLDRPPRPALGAPPQTDQHPNKGDEDPFRRYYDSGDTWR